MIPLHQGLFDIFALALPRGHGFGDHPPIEAWQCDDQSGCAAVTRHDKTGSLGLLVMRRREDQVWMVTCDRQNLPNVEAARALADSELKCGQPAEQIPSGIPRRPRLHDLEGRTPSDVFRLLTSTSHRNAAWLLNQLYLSLPKPDRNWASDCQTANFHTRLWEAQLLASFREQGLLVTQPEESPDFRIGNRRGDVAWVEAVTANPQTRYDHVGSRPTIQPDAANELFFGAAAVRFAKTIGSKLQNNYHQRPHVRGQPFALALADFHAPSSMVWSREALLGYLMGIGAVAGEIGGTRVPVIHRAERLLGSSGFPAGLFTDARNAELSAVIFSNACTLGKFNRMAITLGAADYGMRYVRYGQIFDRTHGALAGIPFCLDVAGADYRSLWPERFEPWCAELEVFHNPYGAHPLPDRLLPEATHWHEIDGEWQCRSHYATSILWSKTLILDQGAPIPSYEKIPEYLASLGHHRNG